METGGRREEEEEKGRRKRHGERIGAGNDEIVKGGETQVKRERGKEEIWVGGKEGREEGRGGGWEENMCCGEVNERLDQLTSQVTIALWVTRGN